MEVIKIKPFGFCAGVDNALKIALQAKTENPNKRIYLLGMIVHNEDVISFLSNQGFILLDERTESLENLILGIPDNEIVVFSAHGHPSNLDKIAASKNLKIYDATCRFVKENMNIGKVTDDLIYIGVKNHLESEAFIKENPFCSFFNLSTNQFESLNIKGSNPKVISQTTISSLELEQAYKTITSLYPNAEILSERCNSTSLRQKEISLLDNSIDLLIVLGSRTSNNSKKLVELGVNRGIKSVLLSNINEVRTFDLNGIKKVALASGASTSRESFIEVATFLEQLN